MTSTNPTLEELLVEHEDVVAALRKRLSDLEAVSSRRRELGWNEDLGEHDSDYMDVISEGMSNIRGELTFMTRQVALIRAELAS